MNCPDISMHKSRLSTGTNSSSRANASDLHQYRDEADASQEPPPNRFALRGNSSKRGAPAARGRHCS